MAASEIGGLSTLFDLCIFLCATGGSPGFVAAAATVVGVGGLAAAWSLKLLKSANDSCGTSLAFKE